MAYTTIDKPSDYFNTVLYTGNATSRSITGVGFQPDFVWNKDRSAVRDNRFIDSVRGTDQILYSNLTQAEDTSTQLTSFDSDGFSINTSNGMNFNGSNFVTWCWLAGGTASSNTDGSITSSVSANTTSGFSIVGYTGNSTGGATVGHGLGQALDMIILKRRINSAEDWYVWNNGLASTQVLYLNGTQAALTRADFNNTIPTSSVFSLSGGDNVNNSSSTYIAYCFAEKKGFSKFGSYSGNSSNDGTFVYTGFKPAMVIVKCSNSVENWVMWDNKRSPFNVVNDRLFPNLSNAESTSPDICDLVSNGFKFRYGPEGSWNTSGNNYIYMAFAENPFTTSTGIPCTAR